MDEYVLICGSRYWDDRSKILKFVHKLSKETIIIHGDQYGADKISGESAEIVGLRFIPFPANWNEYGNSAGPIRNQQILNFLIEKRQEGSKIGCVAFHEDPLLGSGTRNMVKKCASKNIDVTVFFKEIFDRKIFAKDQECYGCERFLIKHPKVGNEENTFLSCDGQVSVIR
jgi:hypothetical protein